jgi:tetratricopeptide (TPR) repeat protein
VTIARPPLPDSYEGLLSQAQMAHRVGAIAEAITLYQRLVQKLDRLSERILQRRPELGEMDLQAGLELTELLRSEGRFAEAHQVLNKLASKHPDHAAAWRRDLASLRVAKGEVPEGLAELRALAEEEPQDHQDWIALGREARIEGGLRESEDALDHAQRVLSTRAVVDQASASSQGREAQAEVHFEQFLLFKDMGRLDDAMAAWEQAVAHDPTLADTVRDLYTALTNAGRYSDAQRYVERDQNPLCAGFQRGLIAQMTGKPILAREEWQGVAALDPEEFSSGQDCWVEAVLRLGDPEPAIEILGQLLRASRSPRLLTLSGIAWAMRGDADLASTLFQQSLNSLRRRRPPKQKLDSKDWHLLDSLVTDDEIKTALKPYFAVIETVWAKPGTYPR